MEATDKSGRLKLTVELEVNPALMDLVKDNMENMMNMAAQMRPQMGQGGKGKMGEGEGHGMGMMHHGQQ